MVADCVFGWLKKNNEILYLKWNSKFSDLNKKNLIVMFSQFLSLTKPVLKKNTKSGVS